MNGTLRLVVVLGLLVLAGCPRKKPSPEYDQANQLYSSLYAEKLDDAYTDPRMAQVEQLLQAVPPKSLDAPAAQELLQKIQTERARVQAENAKIAAAVADATKPTPGPVFPQAAPGPSAPDAGAGAPIDAGVDAGAPEPVPGMPLSEFTGRFSDCFEAGQPVTVGGQGRRDTWVLSDRYVCHQRLPHLDGMLVVTGADQVVMIVPKTAVEMRLEDGGLPPGGSP